MIQNKKKVVHLTTAHPITSVRIFKKECQTLYEHGFPVCLIVPNEKTEINSGIIINSVPKPKGIGERITKTLLNVYRKAVKEDADIYHFHDPELLFVGFILKLKGKKVIYDVHEDVPRQILSKNWISKPVRKIIAWLFERLELFAASKFDAIVGATPTITKRFESINKKAVTIYNYPRLNELYADEVDVSNKQCAVCYIGGISQIRGIFEMTQAIGQINVCLLLGGQFSSRNEREKAISMTGWKNVEELGLLDRQQVRDTLCKSMAGLVLFHPEPNHINAQPNKLFEYMSAGIPVIASDFPLWMEIIKSNNCGLCTAPLNPEAIADTIQWMIDHPDKAKEMGQNGRRAVEEKYNWEKESDKLVALYKELLG